MFQTWEIQADPARSQRLAAAALAALGVLTAMFAVVVLMPPGVADRPTEPAIVVAFRPPSEVKKVQVLKAIPPPPKVVKPRPPAPVDALPMLANPVPAPAAAAMVAPKAMPTERPPETTANNAVAEAIIAVGGTGDGSGTGSGEAESPAPVVASAGLSGPINLPEDAEPAEPNEDNGMPEYPESARTIGQESVVILKVVIESDGRVGRIQVMKGEEPFLAAALNAVKSWTYEPAKLDGKAISIYKIIKLPFRLRND